MNSKPRTERKRVLLVAYDYPPSKRGVGVIRPSKFARFLPEFGWDPIVLAVTVPTVTEDVPTNNNVEVYRVPEWPHPLKAYGRFREQRAKKKGRSEEFAVQMSMPHAAAMSRPKWGIARFKRWLLDFLCVPDQELGWLIPAILKGMRLIREKKITHLITTAPPFTSQLVGLVLKRFTGVQWVADFRDPWSLTQKYTVTRNRVTDAVESRLIRYVIEQADYVLSVTSPMTEQLKKEHPDLNPDKFVTLTNGFDPADFIGLPQLRPVSGPIVFSYLGEFYFGRTPEPFLRALKTLLDDGTLKLDDVRIKFVGNVAVAEGQSVSAMVRKLGLETIVTIGPQVPRTEALTLTMQSHVLLVLTEQHSYALTFKVFEALASGGAILNIGSGGAVAELLAQTARGIAVDHRNISEIRSGILECIRRSRCRDHWRDHEPWRDAVIQPYNFRELTGRLAALMDEPMRTKS